MKKQIQTKKIDTKVYSTIKKLSLAMTIIGWVALFITLASLAVAIVLKADAYQEIRQKLGFVAIGGGLVMILYLFLSIGQIVLGTKVNNITPVTTGKQAIIVFAVALGVGLLCVAGVAILALLENGKDPSNALSKSDYIIIGLIVIAILAYTVEAIASTIILAQIKVNKPVKKGK